MYYRRLLSDRDHVAATVAMMARWDVRPLLAVLPQVRSRVASLVGDRDQFVSPWASRAAAQSLPSSRAETFRALEHLLHKERPAAAAIRGFASETGAPSGAAIPRKAG